MDASSMSNIVINDLLSFLVSKLKLLSKEHLLSLISNFYSKTEIAESHKVLLASLPIKKSTRHGRRVKRADAVLAIYDCIQRIPEEDMPLLVCRNINNIPHINTETMNAKDMYDCRTSKDFQSNRQDFEAKAFNLENSQENVNLQNQEEMNDALCRKEQKQMKLQISQMMSIINELKDGLIKLNENSDSCTEDQNSACRMNSKKKTMAECNGKSLISAEDKNWKIPEAFIPSNVSTTKDNSQLSGLALIQKLIDEDAEDNKLSVMEEEDPCEYSSDSEDLSEVERFMPRNLQINLPKSRKKKNAFRGIPSAQSKVPSKEIIAIKDEPFDDDHEKTIEISASDGFIMGLQGIGSSSKVSGASLSHDDSDSDNVKPDLRACAPEKCPICDITFISKLDYDLHAKTHYTKGSYDCPLCDQGFPSREHLVDHFVVCFKDAKDRCSLEEYTCPTCGSFFADQRSLIKHKAFHSECRLFPCMHCSFRYFSNDALQLHIRNQHNPMNKFQCGLCDLSFLCNSYLKIHMAIHTGAKPFSCNICNYKADNKKAIKQHIHTHGGNPPKKYKCKECDFTCSGKYIILKHRQLEHREPISCALCDKTFKSPSAYKRHYDIHRGKNNFKCVICTYTTCFKRYLIKHMTTHPANSKFVCPICGIHLSNKYTIGHHLRKYCKNNNKHCNSFKRESSPQ